MFNDHGDLYHYKFIDFLYQLLFIFIASKVYVQIKIIRQMYFRQQTNSAKKNNKVINLFDDVLQLNNKFNNLKSKQNFKPKLSQQIYNSTQRDNNKQLNYQPLTQRKKSTDSKNSSLSHKSFKNNYVSPYQNQSRLEKIMKLKPNSNLSKNKITKFDFDQSVGSIDTINSHKQNKSKVKVSGRLQKIMKLKVPKPKIESRLSNYTPLKLQKTISSCSKRSDSSILQLKQVKKLMDRMNKQQDKQERIWKNFQRERQKNLKEKEKKDQKHYLKQRRIQKKIQTMVSKQMHRIQAEKNREYKKIKGFNEFV